jgi:phospholipid/cholesterol/gamma-HCH transport system permease protein
MNVVREPEYFPPPANLVGWIGRMLIFTCRDFGRATLMLGAAIVALPSAFKRRGRRETIVQMYVSGIRSLVVITVVAVFTGMILALQTGLLLRDYNQESKIGAAVMVSMLREMGPFMTGLILSACVGSAMTAQLGTMVVSEEVSALSIMSIDPVRFLVVPRLAAMAVMTPLLSFYTCIMGTAGGGIVGMTQLDVSWQTYVNIALLNASLRDLRIGMFKAFLFGIMITTVACHCGFSTSGGAVGVGYATRRSVIANFLAILIVGYYVSRIFYS